MNLKAQEAIWRYGPKALAKKMAEVDKSRAATSASVYGWLHGKCRPRYPKAELVVKILPKSDGVTVNDIMAAHEDAAETPRRSAAVSKASKTTKQKKAKS